MLLLCLDFLVPWLDWSVLRPVLCAMQYHYHEYHIMSYLTPESYYDPLSLFTVLVLKNLKIKLW